MIDKNAFKEIMVTYGEKYSELKNLLDARARDITPDDNFFRLKNPPGRIFIEPTNRCNKNCIYCARESMQRDMASMGFEDFKRAVSLLPKGTYIILTGNGEPLINKDIYKMIEYARGKGFLVGIITNGTMLNETNARKLIEAKPNRVQISFDAIDEEVFNISYSNPKGNCDYKNTLSKILNFILLEKSELKKGIFITIASVLTEHVKKVREKSLAFWDSLPIDNYYEGCLLSLQTNSGIKEKVVEEEWHVCVNPWTSIKINSDGSVNPCIQDFSNCYSIGSVKEDNLLDIINSEKAISLRKALWHKDIKFFKQIGYNCHDCSAWQSNVQHDIQGYLNDSFPITYGLMIEEASMEHVADKNKIENLLVEIKKLK